MSVYDPGLLLHLDHLLLRLAKGGASFFVLPGLVMTVDLVVLLLPRRARSLPNLIYAGSESSCSCFLSLPFYD